MSIVDLFGGIIGLYKVVPTDEAHVRVMNNKREVFMSGKYKDVVTKSGYWITPTVTKVTKLPLTNIAIPVNDIKLNDSNMAKFQCDIVCFVKIEDPIIASERTGITKTQERFQGQIIGMNELANDFRVIVESVARTVAAKQTILQIYQDRSKLDDSITNEVKGVFPQWGIGLVNVEIKDIKDVPGSTIISDIERKNAAEISADARIKVAEQNSKAQIVEAEKTKEAEMKTAQNEEEWQKRRIEKNKAIAIAEAIKKKEEAEKQKEANVAQIEAESKLTVGRAEIDKQKVEIDADADAARVETAATAKSKQIKLEGEANADIIEATKIAEAKGTLELAKALKEYNDAGIQLERMKIDKDIQIAQATSMGKALEAAKISIVAGSAQEIITGGFFGDIKVGPKQAAAYKQFKDMGGELPIGNAQESIETATKVEGTKKLAEKK